MSALGPAEETQPGWWSQPDPNVLCIYLKEDIPTAVLLAHCERVLRDHAMFGDVGSEVTLKIERKDSNSLSVTKDEGAMKLSVTLTAGQHPVAGNMVAIEARVISETGKKIAKAVLIGLGVLVVVAVVALVAVAAADGGGGGGGGHHGGGSNFIFIGGGNSCGGGSSSRSRRRRARASARAVGYYSGRVMYRTIDHNNCHDFATPTIVTTMTTTVSPVRIVDDPFFKTTGSFIAYLFDNFKNYFWNAGFVRVPDEAVLSRGATPLDHRLQHRTVRGLGSSLYTISVPEHACLGQSDTLRVDVVADRALKVQLKHGAAPSRFTSGTATGRLVGNNYFSVAAGPGASILLKPGLWYISVKNPSISTATYSICAKLFQDTDKDDINPALMGGAVTVRTVEHDDNGDAWELIECADGAVGDAAVSVQGGSSASAYGALTAVDHPSVPGTSPTVPALVPVSGHGLTQGTDLRLLSDSVLRSELFARGVRREYADACDRSMLEATLFSLLPPAPQCPVTSQPLQMMMSHPPQYPVTTQPPQYSRDAPTTASAPPPSDGKPDAPMLSTEQSGADDAAAPPYTPTDTAGDGADAGADTDDEVLAEGEPPYEFCCPITQDVLADPVIAADGFTYERTAMETWLNKNNTSPLTGMELAHKNLTPNLSLRTIIVAWQQDHSVPKPSS